jgi:rubrerythrin
MVEIIPSYVINMLFDWLTLDERAHASLFQVVLRKKMNTCMHISLLKQNIQS